jgi:hypothetical protein
VLVLFRLDAASRADWSDPFGCLDGRARFGDAPGFSIAFDCVRVLEPLETGAHRVWSGFQAARHLRDGDARRGADERGQFGVSIVPVTTLWTPSGALCGFGASDPAPATLAAKLTISANDPATISTAASAAVSLVRKIETVESGNGFDMESPPGSIIAKPSTC